MAITSGFFNSVDGDRRYNAEQIGRYLQYLVSDGVYAHDSTSLQVLANDGMEVQVQPGRAMLDHHFLDNDAPIVLTLAAGGTQDRIDAVIMYVDMTERACGITVKQGTPAASPTAPEMTRTDVRKEYMLAKVHVTKLSSTITQASITDTRADTAVCGWVTGLIKQVDTAALFAQWQAAYEAAYAEFGDYLTAQQAAWETFFASVTEDNVLPAPSLADAGKAVVVNENGDGYELQDPPKATAAVNLLDNSDFTNPVNQRGATAYEQNGYTIDRWYSNAGSLEVTLEDGQVSLYDPQASGTLMFYQRLGVALSTEKKYTMAVKLADGTVHTAVVQGLSANTTGEKTAIGDLGQLYLWNNGTWTAFVIGIHAKKTIPLVWAALYEGEYTADTLPGYVPRGYGAELRECRRYYRQSWHGAIADMTASGSVPFIRSKGGANTQMAVNWHDPMRITPTIEIYSPGTKAKNFIRDWIGSADKPVGGAGYASPYGFCLVLKDSGTTEGTDYVFHYTASADL